MQTVTTPQEWRSAKTALDANRCDSEGVAVFEANRCDSAGVAVFEANRCDSAGVAVFKANRYDSAGVAVVDKIRYDSAGVAVFEANRGDSAGVAVFEANRCDSAGMAVVKANRFDSAGSAVCDAPAKAVIDGADNNNDAERRRRDVLIQRADAELLRNGRGEWTACLQTCADGDYQQDVRWQLGSTRLQRKRGEMYVLASSAGGAVLDDARRCPWQSDWDGGCR